MNNLKTEIKNCSDLKSLAALMTEPWQCKIGWFGGRYYSKVNGNSGTVSLNEIVQKLQLLSNSLDIARINSAEICETRKNRNLVIDRIKILDDIGTSQLKITNCFYRFCTWLKRCFGFKLDRQAILNNPIKKEIEIREAVSLIPEATKAAQEKQEKDSQLTLRGEVIARNTTLLSRLVRTKRLLDTPIKTYSQSLENGTFTQTIQSYTKVAQAEIDTLTSEEQINKFLCHLLEISESESSSKQLQGLIEYRLAVLKQYAQIFEKYTAHELADLRIISAVSQVFAKHFKRSDANLFETGSAISVSKNFKYFAKVEEEKIYIIAGTGIEVSHTESNFIHKVDEIATKQVMILKMANVLRNDEADKPLKMESNILKKIHTNGIKPRTQRPPNAMFNIREEDLVATLNHFYPKGDLENWLKSNPSPIERLRCCKKVIESFQEKCDSGYWHGDIKLKNFFVDNPDDPFLADWEGAVTFEETQEKLKYPDTISDGYFSKADLENREAAIKDNNAEILVKVGKSSDLYALSIVLYKILTKAKPYRLVNYGYKVTMPDTTQKLDLTKLQMFFSDRVVSSFSRMLSHNPIDRDTWEQVRKTWESISAEQDVR